MQKATLKGPGAGMSKWLPGLVIALCLSGLMTNAMAFGRYVTPYGSPYFPGYGAGIHADGWPRHLPPSPMTGMAWSPRSARPLYRQTPPTMAVFAAAAVYHAPGPMFAPMPRYAPRYAMPLRAAVFNAPFPRPAAAAGLAAMRAGPYGQRAAPAQGIFRGRPTPPSVAMRAPPRGYMIAGAHPLRASAAVPRVAVAPQLYRYKGRDWHFRPTVAGRYPGAERPGAGVFPTQAYGSVYGRANSFASYPAINRGSAGLPVAQGMLNQRARSGSPGTNPGWVARDDRSNLGSADTNSLTAMPTGSTIRYDRCLVMNCGG